MDEYFPLAHNVQVLAPLAEKVDAGHDSHWVAPIKEYKPAAQFEHKLKPEDEENVPAVHCTHEVAAAPLVYPAEHGEHVDADAGEYVPAAQAAVTPLLHEYPAGQGKQEVF